MYTHDFFLLILLFFPPFQSKFSMESLTKPELLMLFSILEGELEARDLVIDALKVLTVSSLTLIFMLLCAAVHLFAVCHFRLRLATEPSPGQKQGLCPHIERRSFEADLSNPL